LAQLSINNQKLLEQLNQSKQDLATASSQLATLKAQLVTLQTQTQLALQQQNQAQNSLKIANESFQKFEQEVKAENRKLKLQRDLGYLAAIAMAFVK
jgi:chromosome segregation ATPase